MIVANTSAPKVLIVYEMKNWLSAAACMCARMPRMLVLRGPNSTTHPRARQLCVHSMSKPLRQLAHERPQDYTGGSCVPQGTARDVQAPEGGLC